LFYSEFVNSSTDCGRGNKNLKLEQVRKRGLPPLKLVLF
jgi:hypothetical protein